MSIGNEKSQLMQLEQIQKWMQSVITHTDGLNHAVNKTDVEKIIAPSANLSGTERLGIYQRSYQARLLQCFQSMFPCLLFALGEELFDRFAIDYLKHYPPTSYTIDKLADSFPEHLSKTRPDAPAPEDERESWPDFIIDMATFELALIKLFDGEGVEGKKLLSELDVLAMSDEEISRNVFTKVQCLRLFHFRYPVHDYWLAVREEKNPELPSPTDIFMAITRKNYRVLWYELTPSQFALLQSNERQFVGINTIREWLCDWANKGFFEKAFTV